MLLRHCRAGSRDAWAGDDLERPLDARGRRQATALARTLPAAAGGAISGLFSSPYVRCRQSLEPLAAGLRLRVEILPELAEDAGHAAMDRIRAVAGGCAVWCSHGDVLPALLRRIASEDGLEVGPSPRCEKGSAWLLSSLSPGRFSSARYLPPLEE